MLQLESSLHWRSVDHVLTYSGRQIVVGSQKPSRITRQKTCCASESNTSVRVVFANRSGFDAPIVVVLAWEERGSCLNLFRTTYHAWILETITNYEAKDLLRKQKTCCARESNTPFMLYLRTEVVLLLQLESSWHGRSVDHVLTYSGRQMAVGSQKPHELRGKIFVAQESSWHGRSLDHVLAYSGWEIVLGSQKPSRITRQKTCCASESKTPVRVVFANRSGFDAPIGVFLAWEKRRSCLNIFRTKKSWSDLKNLYELRGKRLDAQVCQTRRFALYLKTGVVKMLQLGSSWQGWSVDHVLTYSGRKIMVGSQKPSRITSKRLVAQVSQTRRFALYLRTVVVLMLQLESSGHGSQSNTSVCVVFANRSGFDAAIGVVLAWEERGSCIKIFRMKNHGRISETFTNFEAKTCCATESNTSVRVVFANRSGFDASIGVVMAWE
ncbi:uncharacterized protein G2W53_014290 [Senna tora]|uniref:Uncharacterized protein n=1 Tax=Senna tora TaxID=362788 RepID=A0A834WT90_9FABA|nr:uncharacterized protein G2W53_014290 [Senna tora]